MRESTPGETAGRKKTWETHGVRVESVAPVGASKLDPIIFVHGGCHGSWCFDNFQSVFAAGGWQGHALNWFNHNGSASLPADKFLARGIPEVAEEIGHVAATLSKPPILIAHSMGGMAAQKYAERHPTRALVLLAPVVSSEANVAPINVPLVMDQPFHLPPEIASSLFFDGLEAEEAMRCYRLLCPESPTCVQQATRFTISVDYAKIGCPILAFGAENDPLVPGAYVRSLAELAKADFRMLPGRGHNLLMEPHWRDTASEIAHWLDELPPSA